MNRSRFATAAGLAALAVACAGPYGPPGGTPIVQPPRVVETQPGPGEVVPGWRGAVVFRFDERISERGLDTAVVVSPETGRLRIDRGRREIRVRLEGGWQPDRVYRVQLLPGIQDLFGNVRRDRAELVFSTGAAFPQNALGGFVTDRLTLRPTAGARVEAILEADSTVYVTRSDTAGFFSFQYLPEGAYRVRAYQDANRNRRPDAFEPQAETRAVLAEGDTLAFALALLVPDTTPARLARAEARDSLQIRVAFDDHLDPERPLDDVTATIRRLPDSVGVEVAAVLHLHEFQELRRAASPDTAAPPDTVPPPDDARPPPGDLMPPGAAGPVTPGAVADTAPPLPSRELVVVPAAPLEGGASYEVELHNVTNIAGVPGGGGRTAFDVAPASPPPPQQPPTER